MTVTKVGLRGSGAPDFPDNGGDLPSPVRKSGAPSPHSGAGVAALATGLPPRRPSARPPHSVNAVQSTPSADLALMAERVAATTAELVRIPSQGGIDDPRAICAALSEKLSAAGLAPSLLTDSAGAPVGVVALIEGGRPGPTYALDAVVDTAPVGDATRWRADPFGGTIRDGHLIGRGAADSKVGAAIFIEVGRELAARRNAMAGRTVLFFDAAEHTGEFQGVTALRERFPELDGVLIGYPGSDALCIGSRGFWRAELGLGLQPTDTPRQLAAALLTLAARPLPEATDPTFSLPPRLTLTAVAPSTHVPWTPTGGSAVICDLRIAGDAAHSGGSKPRGVNAILKAARLIERLAEASEKVVGPDASPHLLDLRGGASFAQVPDLVQLRLAFPAHPAQLDIVRALVERQLAAVDDELPAAVRSGLAATSAKAGACEALGEIVVNVDVRLTPSFNAGAAATHVASALADGRRHSPSLSATVSPGDSWPAFVLPPTHPLRRSMEDAITAAGSHGQTSKVSGPSNVGNLLAAHGIPATTGFGVSFTNMHATDESIELSSIGPTLAVYRRAVAALMDLPPPDGRPSARGQHR